ncbi:alpha/beta hydrolase [Candidatus Mycobacterium wuenschmannii]|uniref:Alpha/beta hydrolase n=1 Tax=Candidatus Mycobacterium wuenschmannii TaxID=3027808 RepID=A0ABY8W2D7_9MYCO|nr:alpha/beta hydrolase [Candidatus Mycobacterium wuenschmannii]WIM89187.1 alpha/beta hydrolase [Candidatus Mycobacterium wuenschmannii]
MTLTVADIDRWNSAAVREVFRAASARGQATLDAARQLGTLAVFDTWEGATAEARKHANAGLRVDLDAHGNEALAVARAAEQAADGIDRVQSELRALRHDAAALHMAIDVHTDALVPVVNCLALEAVIAGMQLQPMLDAILAAATAIDDELAAAIDMADGDAAIVVDDAPPVGPPGLTPTQRQDAANRDRLREDRARLQARIDDLTRTLGGPNSLRDIPVQLEAARSRLVELDAVDTALGRAPQTYLTELDIPADPRRKVTAAVAVGNPDTATGISVTVPGLGSSARDSLPGMVAEARILRNTANGELRRLGRAGSVATIAWVGYDPPPDPLDTNSPRDYWRTLSDAQARSGATALAPYLQRLHAGNPAAHLSLFGHSYGSLTASLALQRLHSQGLHPVDEAVFYGSPGLGLSDPGRLGLASGHAFVMKAPPGGDWITELAPLAPLHGWGADPYAGMLPELSSQSGTSPDGVRREGVHNHSAYVQPTIRPGGEPLLRMSGYNLAVIAAGIAALPDGREQLMMAPTLLAPYPHPGRR